MPEKKYMRKDGSSMFFDNTEVSVHELKKESNQSYLAFWNGYMTTLRYDDTVEHLFNEILKKQVEVYELVDYTELPSSGEIPDMSDLRIVGEVHNTKMYRCYGKPEKGDDVQHYYFSCSHCNGPLKHQPQFCRFVDDGKGLDIMCWDCAEGEGFDNVFHNNMSIRHTHIQSR